MSEFLNDWLDGSNHRGYCQTTDVPTSQLEVHNRHFDTVVLDADGVVNDGRLLSLESDFGIPQVRLERFFEAFDDSLLGKKDLRDILIPYLSEWGWQGTVDELIAYWFEAGSTVNETVIRVVRALRSQGLPVYLATNQDRRRTEYMVKQMGYGNLFTRVFSSSLLGAKKPNKEFFRRLHAGLGPLTKSRVLFWDDNPHNVHAAQRFGYHAVLFSSANDFASQMRNWFGIHLPSRLSGIV